MNKKFCAFGFAALTCTACFTMAACSLSAKDTSTATLTYSDDSLIAYHLKMGSDIAELSEVSIDACGTCHGTFTELQADTENVLTDDSLSANPHINHMFKEFECSDCHKLTESSTLGCNNTCHTWNISRNNGTWAQSA